MAKHIGVVGCSAEGAALCYRTLCLEGGALLGEYDHPEITLHTISLARYMARLREGGWRAVTELMLESARKVALAGADFAICPDNTVHEAFEFVRPASPLPWLHIAEVVAEEARAGGFRRLAVLGTRYLMEGPVYPGALQKHGIVSLIPDEADRERIHQIIFKELVNGVFTEEARRFFNEVMGRMRERGCDAAVLGCTEIPLLVRPEEAPLPTLDSTRLLARAALRLALSPDETQTRATRQ
jgi:aspartate racemase